MSEELAGEGEWRERVPHVYRVAEAPGASTQRTLFIRPLVL